MVQDTTHLHTRIAPSHPPLSFRGLAVCSTLSQGHSGGPRTGPAALQQVPHSAGAPFILLPMDQDLLSSVPSRFFHLTRLVGGGSLTSLGRPLPCAASAAPAPLPPRALQRGPCNPLSTGCAYLSNVPSNLQPPTHNYHQSTCFKVS